VTRITYLAPEGRSAQEIFENYREALEGADFEILYRCAEESCGQRFASAAFPMKEQGLPASVGTSGIEEQHYLAAELRGEIFVSVYVYFDKTRFVGSSPDTRSRKRC
jgi:hypothetical protein